ncbi:MAG: formate dehydrogenase accessory sulfurtransferase FdhD [Lautropia sp.]|nr:formate dehydrogenase accessory sulfurtransferase FdhD [Lautropia sp.]
MTAFDEATAEEDHSAAVSDSLSGADRFLVSVWLDGEERHVPDAIASEVPVALLFNGISHAVMMATPTDLEDFALGFGLTEGLLQTPAELYGVDVVPVAEGLEVQLEVSSACAWRLRERRRNLAGRTGCGLCGTDSLAQVCQTLPRVHHSIRLQAEALLRAEHNLREAQQLQRLTGSTHAAAWCDVEGNVRLLREDVGRHNALDKLIGAMIHAKIDPARGFVAITSRASFEMVQKTAMARVGALLAVSAPTSMAIKTARMHGIALAGLVRGRRMVAYSHPERLGWKMTSD